MTADPKTVSDFGVDISNLEVGERLYFHGVTGDEVGAIVCRMDSAQMGVMELADGSRALFHAYNVTRRPGRDEAVIR